MDFHAGLQKPASLKAKDEEGNTAYSELSVMVEKALTKPLTRETVEQQLTKTGGTPYRVAECFVDIEEGISIPLSKLNELRRTVLAELEVEQKTMARAPLNINWNQLNIDWDLPRTDWSLPKTKSGKASYVEAASEQQEDHFKKEELCLYYHRVKPNEQFDPGVYRIYVPYDAVLDGRCDGLNNTVPVIPNITKGWYDEHISKNFDKIVANSATNGVAVGNLGWVEPFVRAGVNVFGDYGLNLYNSMDFYLAGELGMKEAVIAHEADFEDMLKMNFHGVIPEVVIKGRIPVMVSGHCPGGDLKLCPCNDKETELYLKDRRGQFYPVLMNSDGCSSMILSQKETNLTARKTELKKAGIKRFRIYVG